MAKLLLSKAKSGDYESAKSEDDLPIWELKNINNNLLSPSKLNNRASMRQKNGSIR